MSIPNTNFYSSNYSNDLNNVFPVVEYHYKQITGNNNSASGTINLNNDFGTNDYAVFTSFYYGYSGSSSTYDAQNTSSAITPMVINSITSSSFEWVFTKTTGDDVNIYIVFMVVYNKALDYSKSYS